MNLTKQQIREAELDRIDDAFDLVQKNIELERGVGVRNNSTQLAHLAFIAYPELRD